MKRKFLLFIAGAALLSAAACAGMTSRGPEGEVVSAPTPTVPGAPVFRETGSATWSGPGLHGRTTASGSAFDMNGMFAAHRTLPLGTVVRVTNLESYKSITVPVTDRGPFLKSYVIGLSYGAARELDFVERGSVQVRIETDRPVTEEGAWTVLAAVFAEEENARVLKYRLSQRYRVVSIVSFENNIGIFHRVLVGNYQSEEMAERIAAKLTLEGLEPLVLRKD